MEFVGTIVVWLILSVIFGCLLSVSIRILDRQGSDFSDCFKTSLAALGVIMLLGWFGAFDSEAYGWVIDLIAGFVIWSICISMFIGLTLGRSLVVALVFTILQWVIGFILLMILASAVPS